METVARKRICIAFGSRYGATDEVAAWLADRLQQRGLVVELLDTSTRRRKWPALDRFDGVIIGSGIKIGRWTKGSKTFLAQVALRCGQVRGPGLAVGVFVCCGLAAEDPDTAREKYIDPVVRAAGLPMERLIAAAFGPVYDLGPRSQLSGFGKKIVRGILEKEMAENGNRYEYDLAGRNDRRDWSLIGAFADLFTRRLGS